MELTESIRLSLPNDGPRRQGGAQTYKAECIIARIDRIDLDILA